MPVSRVNSANTPLGGVQVRHYGVLPYDMVTLFAACSVYETLPKLVLELHHCGADLFVPDGQPIQFTTPVFPFRQERPHERRTCGCPFMRMSCEVSLLSKTLDQRPASCRKERLVISQEWLNERFFQCTLQEPQCISLGRLQV